MDNRKWRNLVQSKQGQSIVQKGVPNIKDLQEGKIYPRYTSEGIVIYVRYNNVLYKQVLGEVTTTTSGFDIDGIFDRGLGDVLYYNGEAWVASPLDELPSSVAALAIQNGGTGSSSTTYCNLTSNVTGTLPVGNGGTGQTTLAANSLLTGNGTSGISAEANATYDATNAFFTLTSSVSGKPRLEILNTHSGTDGGEIKFTKDKGAAGANNDVAGKISFYTDDDAQAQNQVARIEGSIVNAADGSERGGLKLLVQPKADATLESGLTMVGTPTTDEIDVTIGNGSSSVTTVTGALKVSSNIIQASDGGHTITMDDDDNVTILGDLTISGSKATFGNGAIIDNETSMNVLSFHTENAYKFMTTTGQPLIIGLHSDLGEDDIDQWTLHVTDGGVMTFQNKASGSDVAMLTFTPHATAASSTVEVAGNLTTGGDLTVNGNDINFDAADSSIKVADQADTENGDELHLYAGSVAAGGDPNKVGGDLKLYAGKGKGSAAGGAVGIYVSPASTSGTTVNNHEIAMLTRSDKTTKFEGAVILGANQIQASDSTVAITTDTDGNVVSGGYLKPGTSLYISKLNAAEANIGNHGQLWVKNENPVELWFTEAGGSDIQITSGTSLAQSVKIASVTINQSDMNALHTTEQTIVAAQGANKIIMPTSCFLVIDRSTLTAQASSSADLFVSYDGATSISEVIYYQRRFMYNESGDRILHLQHYNGEVAQSITDGENKPLTVKLDSGITTGSIVSMKVVVSYHVFDNS